MSFSGLKILENDFACDIHDDFFQRYDAGQKLETLAEAITADYEAEILSPIDREVFLTAVAECLWSVGQPVDSLRRQIIELLESDTTANFWSEQYAARKKILLTFVRKLSKPKAKPVAPRKVRAPKRLPFAEGDYLLFEKQNKKRVVVIVAAVETRGKLRYDFAIPNLSRSTDTALTGKLVCTPAAISDEELATFFPKSRRFRMSTFEHSTIKGHLGRFQKIGNRPFNWSVWQYGACGYGVTFDDFERLVNESGTRGLTPEELQLAEHKLASEETRAKVRPTH